MLVYAFKYKKVGEYLQENAVRPYLCDKKKDTVKIYDAVYDMECDFMDGRLSAL